MNRIGNEKNQATGKNSDAKARAARYVVFYVEAWGRWVGCIDQSEVMQRASSTGGYLGVAKGFFVY